MLRRAVHVRGYATRTSPLFNAEAGRGYLGGHNAEASSSSSNAMYKAESNDSRSTQDSLAPAVDEAVLQAREEMKQKHVESLWDRVLQTPAAVLNATPETRPRRSLLEHSTPSPRPFKGTTSARRRAEGQTPHEARRLNDALSRLYDGMEAMAFKPGSVRAKDWDASLRPPVWKRGPRVEDGSPELVVAVDALAEELSVLTSTSEIVTWAQDKVFTREQETRAQFPKTYPRALAALIRTLWVRLNAPHLALAMFEHAKSLGVESYLAGCQTSAYNELVRVRWEAFRDLSGVLEAVKEMEQHAVAWDKGTSGLVGAIVDAVGKEILQAKGRWGKEAYTQLAALEGYLAKDTEREEEFSARQREAKHREVRRLGDEGRRRGRYQMGRDM